MWLSLVALTSPALAQEDRPTITVLATGSALPIVASGQAVSVLDAGDLERVQGIDLTRALERVPGLGWTRNGGPGGYTAVYLRGSGAEQVLVLYDGVRVEDVAAPSGGVDFSLYDPGEVERIEVLRGANSVPWGSAAIGGVIALTSRVLEGAEGRVELGSQGTVSADAAAGLAGDAGQVTLTGGMARTDGVSAAAAGTERDGMRRWRAGARGRLALAPGLALVGSARVSQLRSAIDGFAPPAYTFGDTAEVQHTRQHAGYGGLDYGVGRLTLASGLALAHTRRTYADPAVGPGAQSAFAGRSLRWSMTGGLALPQQWRLHFGADSEWTRYASTFDPRASARIASGHALLGWAGAGGSLSLGLRRDEHDRFGGAWSAGGNGTLRLVEGLRLTGSYGEGFKAPTLFQLLSDYGNAALQPETSRSADLGLAYSSGSISASATLYQRDSRNLIAFVSCTSLGRCTDRPFGLYANVARARAQGLELALGVQPLAGLSLEGAYSYGETRNRTAGTQFGNSLPRRPRHMGTLGADWSPGAGWPSLGADLRWVSASFDDAANLQRLGGHVLMALRTSLALTEQVELYGRIENLGDARYETAAGYGTWGRAGFVGMRARY
jgi:vitamin B12 transporter